jgi:signal transduction histidine kinase
MNIQPTLDFADSLKSLHHVVTKNYHSEDDLFREYLAIGCRIFGLETGVVSQISDQNYTVLSFSSPMEMFSVGMTFDVKDTYCREVFRTKRTVAVPHVGANELMCEFPAYRGLKLESFISSPIMVNDQIFGTINFVDRSTRLQGFDDRQIELLEIMANTIGRFLESKMIKDKLQRAHDRINQLVGVVAHDLKNPLGNIHSLAEVIQEGVTPEELSDYVRMIKSSSSNTLEMVQNILELSAMESGKIKIVKVPHSVVAVVKESWEMIQHLAHKKKITLDLEGVDVSVNLDRRRMIQSLSNLFTNAIKFSHPEKKIHVSVKEINRKVEISVRDEGIGMSQEQIGHLFDPTKTTSTEGTLGEVGTGYGLPLVGQIVSYHLGTIEVHSKIGMGSTFSIQLPTT